MILDVLEADAAFQARASDWFSPEELEQRARLTHEKRRTEWTAGRVAAKRAVQREIGLPFSRLVIRRSERAENRGQPEVFLDGQARLPGFVSITHAGGLAAATYRRSPVGLDLEALIEPTPGFLEAAFSPELQERLLAVPAPERAMKATLAWCEKEAYAKWLGRGFALPLAALDPGRDPRVRLEHGVLPGARTLIWARAETANL